MFIQREEISKTTPPRLPIENERKIVPFQGAYLEVWSSEYCTDILGLFPSAILDIWKEKNPLDWEETEIGHKHFDQHGFLYAITDAHIKNEHGQILSLTCLEPLKHDYFSEPTNKKYKVLRTIYPPIFNREYEYPQDMTAFIMFGGNGRDEPPFSDTIPTYQDWIKYVKDCYIPKCLVLDALTERGLPAPKESLGRVEEERSIEYIVRQWENAIREYEKTPDRRKNDARPRLVRNELYRIDQNTAQALQIQLNEKDNPHRDRSLTWEIHIPKLKEQFPDLPELPKTHKM